MLWSVPARACSSPTALAGQGRATATCLTPPTPPRTAPHRPGPPRLRLQALLRPAGTVMDLNIGAALWLAAGARGTLRLYPPAHPDDASATGSGSGSSCTPPFGEHGLEHGRRPSPAAGSAPCASCSCNTPTCSCSIRGSGGQGGGGGGEGEGGPCPAAAPPPSVHAASGAGGLVDGQPFCSAARVVLLGHGADEQAGGYGRHRTRFRSSGWPGLASELELDVRRLWLRNLGRDDRLVSDWGEAPHPTRPVVWVGLVGVGWAGMGWRGSDLDWIGLARR